MSATVSQQLAKFLTADPGVRLAILFGSAAGKEPLRVDSDVDIAVARAGPLGAADKLALMDALAGITGRPVDVVDLLTAGEPLRGEILTKGHRLVVRDKALLARLMSRHMCDVADFLPIRNRILEQRRRQANLPQIASTTRNPK
ncbi:hypothetical protein B1C78_15725 [Thioalkalivibrio denitrificans]|uniref:Polymerase beta nucleotidyltransferase domain-containing protein n=1 Tax=Thioalkalivibrio denitrificans TaxID=108003 RepID=A0A1V3NAT1_9GAMM|nr:nucleotidyltransferase domain-containing protein [Thioalkalivibrio denitrificans]OOG21998.1 hypothetical protein B1C78_15725 [Thioalkalivibrio denitrificans]